RAQRHAACPPSAPAAWAKRAPLSCRNDRPAPLLPTLQIPCGRLRENWEDMMAVERRGAAIDIAGVRKEYQSGPGRVLALDDINLRIAPGEFLCIVGPSGCGKSTLLRILAGLDYLTGGTIKVEAGGWAVQNAMVFQESGLFPWMNVETNVRFGLDTRG